MKKGSGTISRRVAVICSIGLVCVVRRTSETRKTRASARLPLNRPPSHKAPTIRQSLFYARRMNGPGDLEKYHAPVSSYKFFEPAGMRVGKQLASLFDSFQ
jgi:hypothetical protein